MENGRRVHITTAEQDLLHCFTAAPNAVLSREDISDNLHGRMNGRSIDVAVARLRTKLERDPRFPVFLQTVRGKGWMLGRIEQLNIRTAAANQLSENQKKENLCNYAPTCRKRYLGGCWGSFWCQ